MARPPLAWHERVVLWDAALFAVRTTLREQGLVEVVTPVRLCAVAVEPFIEPIAAPPGFLATSPELPMKRLLCRGAPAIFQIAPCFRAAEHGDFHREEFHLVEWYRVGQPLAEIQRDVERVVAAVHAAIAEHLDEPAVEPPGTWHRHGVLDLFERTMGIRLRGDEEPAALARCIEPVRTALGDPLALVGDTSLRSNPGAHALAAWTAVFSAWCDVFFDPWLSAHRDQGIHAVDFPAPLAALAQAGPTTAQRFESHIHGRELANGYSELRDAAEQRRRFGWVNALRAAHSLPPLPIDEDFMADLRSPGLPPCCGVALGLDRLVLLASGRTRLDDIAIDLGAPVR